MLLSEKKTQVKSFYEEGQLFQTCALHGVGLLISHGLLSILL